MEMGLLLVSCSQSSEVSGSLSTAQSSRLTETQTQSDTHTCIYVHASSSIHQRFTESQFTEICCCVAGIVEGTSRREADTVLTKLTVRWGRVMLNLTRVNSARVSKDFFQMIRRENMKKAAFSYYASGKVNWYKLPGGQRKRKILKMWFSLWPRKP